MCSSDDEFCQLLMNTLDQKCRELVASSSKSGMRGRFCRSMSLATGSEKKKEDTDPLLTGIVSFPS